MRIWNESRDKNQSAVVNHATLAYGIGFLIEQKIFHEMRYLYFEYLVISESVPQAPNWIKWSRFRLKPFVNLTDTNLSSRYEPPFLRLSWAKFICLYSGHWFPPFYGYRRSLQFSRFFKNKEANLGGKLYHVSKFTVRYLWLKYEGSHFSVDVPVLTRSWKKLFLTIDAKKFEGQIKCVQL